MRVTKLVIGGKEYPMCYSTAVDLAVEETFGGLAQLGEAIDNDADRVEKADTLTLAIELMLQGGVRYMELTGSAATTTLPSREEMRELLSMPDMMTAVIDCIKAGEEREIEAKLQKNAAATGGTFPLPPRGIDGMPCVRGFLTRMRSIFRTENCST